MAVQQSYLVPFSICFESILQNYSSLILYMESLLTLEKEKNTLYNHVQSKKKKLTLKKEKKNIP